MIKEGIAGIVILALIIVYSVFVIRRKIRNAKEGKYCSCGCSGCSKTCGKPKRNE